MRKLWMIFLFFSCMKVEAQQLAFPGAEGFGCYTTGGRGGDVYVITSLADHDEHAEEGTLRWAIRKKGPRTIVFAISGTIELEAPLKINNGDVTIAGQTAPGDGICLKNYTVSISADNVIIRFLRFRCGDLALKSSAQDALNGIGHKNIIIDHCSLSWSIDETGSFYDNQNFTMQWCILSESLYDAGHEKGPHGYGGIWGGEGASFHHNLLADHTSRLPRFNGARFSSTPETELVDFRNNVIFNWGFQSSYGGEAGRQNMINNYYKVGPAAKKGKIQYRILDLTQNFYDPNINPDTLHAGYFYIDGNYVEGFPDVSADNWTKGVQKATPEQKLKSKVDQPFAVAPVTTHTAEEAYQLVLAKAGATKPKRDTTDQRIVTEVKIGQCKYGGDWGENTGIIDTEKTVGGWPELKSLPAPKDSDQDGMPDAWEIKNGLNPMDAADRNRDENKDGYTNLEEYLNQLAN